MAWQRDVYSWYPNLHERTYFVPPVQTIRQHYERRQVAGETVFVQQAPVAAATSGSGEVSHSDICEDRAQQRILYCLKQLTVRRLKEVMFILSRLGFNQYLDEPCYVHSGCKLRRPRDLKKQNMDRGDFDMLIIHRYYGLIAVEIKSVGEAFEDLKMSETQRDKALIKRIKQAIKQLNKSDNVLAYIVSDLKICPRIRKCLMFPNIQRKQLQRVLQDDTKINEDLCLCLDTTDAADECLTSDRLSPAGPCFRDVSHDVLNSLEPWWTSVITKFGHDPAMSEQLYDELLARFVGPATRVEIFGPDVSSKQQVVVRIEGQGAHETGERLTKEIILHPEQINVLNSGGKIVLLTGPPGTGKTVVLLLKGKQWSQDGHNVQIISMYSEGIPSVRFVYKWLKQKGCNVHQHLLCLEGASMDRAVDALARRAKGGQLYVLVDEVDGSYMIDFCNKMSQRVPQLNMWLARLFRNFVPRCITHHFQMTRPLRCPAVVVSEIQKSLQHFQTLINVSIYAEDHIQPCEGPAIRTVYHIGGEHSNTSPPECKACGRNVALELKSLHINETLPGSANPWLRYNDVFILTSRFGSFWDCSGFCRGLESARIPTHVRTHGSDLMKDRDAVIAACANHVTGLERKVVVWVPHFQCSPINALAEGVDRLNAIGRCTAQLVTVVWPSQMPAQTKAKAQDLDLD